MSKHDNFTILPCIHTQLVDARWGLGQDVDGAAGGPHVVEEVDGQSGQGEHQEPQQRQHVSNHYKLREKGG